MSDIQAITINGVTVQVEQDDPELIGLSARDCEAELLLTCEEIPALFQCLTLMGYGTGEEAMSANDIYRSGGGVPAKHNQHGRERTNGA